MLKMETAETTEDSLLLSGVRYEALDFENAVKFLIFFSPELLNEDMTLHDWQIEELIKYSQYPATKDNPYKYCLCAANGSGKDKYFIAAVAVYEICCHKESMVVITSASGMQLSNQTERYINRLAKEVNQWAQKELGEDLLDIKQRSVKCKRSGSEIVMFTTDEEGRAEGWHPVGANTRLVIIVNEGKSVPPEIYRAFGRCTGFTHYLLVSSPGEPIGDFHYAYTNWANKRRITIFDCPHLNREEYEEDRKRLGEHDPYFRSKWLAAFTSVGGKNVINPVAMDSLVRQLRNKQPIKEIFQNEPYRIGMDIALSTNGDESVVSVWKGNKQVKQIMFRIKDATRLADHIALALSLLGIPKAHPYIWADDGGVGRAVIDILRRMGWSGINRVLNQSVALNSKQYRNRGAEIWYKFARMIDAGLVIMELDDTLINQLKSRKYKESTAGVDKLTLQSKPEMLAEGLPSPDRADAAVLAWCGVDVNRWLDEFDLLKNKEATKPKSAEDEFISLQLAYRKGFQEDPEDKKKPIFNSLNDIYCESASSRKQMAYY